MNTAITLAGYGLVLAATFGAAVGVGVAVGPVSATTSSAHAHSSRQTADGMNDMNDPTHIPAATMPGMGHGDTTPQGLANSAAGYTLAPASTMLPTGDATEFRFTILGPNGAPVTRYTAEHERELHFIVVRRDLSGYQHLHPVRAADGTWSVALRLPAAGVYKAFADFQPTGANMPLTLATDLFAGGDFQPTALPAATRTAVVDGYTVTLAGVLHAGQESELTFSVAKDGRPVTDLQPYLGAYGHLVALRVGDLAYSHVHPQGTPGDGATQPGPQVSFHAELPTAGGYRLFLDFQTSDSHTGSTVHTAIFTATAGK